MLFKLQWDTVTPCSHYIFAMIHKGKAAYNMYHQNFFLMELHYNMVQNKNFGG